MAEQSGVIFVDLGTIRADNNPALWTGQISLAGRLGSGELTGTEVENRLRQLPDYFVAVTPGASKRCIDGSSSQQALDGYQNHQLGPQIQGGTADEAYAAHLAGLVGGKTLLDDIDSLPQIRRSRFENGNHIDDHADDQSSGCGAQKGQLKKLDYILDTAKAPVINKLADTVLGLAEVSADAQSFPAVQAAATKLKAQPSYFPTADEYVAKFRSFGQSCLELLIRPHAEVSLTINFVPDSTFDRDGYNAGTASKIQNFNLDAWNPLEEYGADSYALVVDAIATTMDLTDGSLRLFARLPKA